MKGRKSAQGIQREMQGVRARMRRLEVDSSPAERKRVRIKLAESIRKHAYSNNVPGLERSLKTIEIMRKRGFFPGKEKALALRMNKGAIAAINSALIQEARSTRMTADFAEKLARLVKNGIVSRARARKLAFSLGESIAARALPQGKTVSASIRVLDERMRAILSIFSRFGVPKSRRLWIQKKISGIAAGAIKADIARKRKRIDLNVFEAIDEAIEKRMVSVEAGDALRIEAIRTILERISRDELSSIGVSRVVLQIEEIHSRQAREKLRALARRYHF